MVHVSLAVPIHTGYVDGVPPDSVLTDNNVEWSHLTNSLYNGTCKNFASVCALARE